MRFNLVPPGEYDIAIRDGEQLVGHVAVRAGAITEFHVDQRASNERTPLAPGSPR